MLNVSLLKPVIFLIDWLWWDVLVTVAESELLHSQLRSCLFWRAAVFSLPAFVCCLVPFLPGRWGRTGGDGWWFVALNMLWWKTWFSRRSVRLARQEPSLICLASGVSTAQSADQAAGGSAESRALFTLQLTAHRGCFFLLSVPRFDVCLFSVNCKKLRTVCTWLVHTEYGLLNGSEGHRLRGPEV